MLRLAEVAAVGRYPGLESVELAPDDFSDRETDYWTGYTAWEAVRSALEAEFARGGVRFMMTGTSDY